MTDLCVPSSELELRLNKLKEKMAAYGCESCMIVQKVSLYYFSGCDQDAHLYVPLEGEPILLVRKSLIRARMDSRLRLIEGVKSFKDMAQKITDLCGRLPKSMGIEMDVVPVRYYLSYRSVFPNTELLDASTWVRETRMVKSPYELERIERAASLGDEMFQYASRLLEGRSFVDETDLASELELFYRKRGHMGLLRTRAFNAECFYGHILAGKGGAHPSNAPGPTAGTGPGPFFSQGAGRNPIRPGEPIMVDYTSSFEGYVSDQARVFCLGPPPQILRDAQKTMVELREVLMEMGRPGMLCSQLYNKALDFMKDSKFKEYFMGYPEPVPFVGHGVGLELDELPVLGKGSDCFLEENMVVALEPKLVFPEYGVVGVEDTCVVAKDGLRSLNKTQGDLIIILRKGP